MILPLILTHARDLGASSTVAGMLGSVYGGVQLFSSPLMGHWSDATGRHWSLWVCLAISGLGYVFMGLATSIPLLALARIPLGIFKHSQSFSRTYLSELVSEKERSAVLGHFNAASSVGFILGPLVGGHVAELQGGFFYSACIAGFIFVLNAALVGCLLPSTASAETPAGDGDMINRVPSSPSLEPNTSTATLQKMARDESHFSLKNLSGAIYSMDWADLWDLFLIKFLAGFSVLMFRSNHILTLKEKFGASPATLGYMTSYSAAVSTFCGFGVGKITSFFPKAAKAFEHALMLQAVTLTCLTFAPSMTFIFIALAPLSLVTTVQRVVATDLTIHRGGKQGRGGLMGLSQSIMSLARMLSPFLAGVAQEVHVDGPAVVAVVTTVCALALMLVRPQDPEQRQRWKAD